MRHHETVPLQTIEIGFQPDTAAFLAEMKLRPGSPQEADCRRLCAEAQELARLRAAWRQEIVRELQADGLLLAGQRFTGSLFADYLTEGQSVFPFLASVGPELTAWAAGYREQMLRYYWADCLAERALYSLLEAVRQALTPLVEAPHLGSFNPGSLPAWPLEEQRPLFALLAGAAEFCAVRLTEDCLMWPPKSCSGIYFSAPQEYYNCQLCPRPDCRSRRASFVGAEPS